LANYSLICGIGAIGMSRAGKTSLADVVRRFGILQ